MITVTRLGRPTPTKMNPISRAVCASASFALYFGMMRASNPQTSSKTSDGMRTQSDSPSRVIHSKTSRSGSGSPWPRCEICASNTAKSASRSAAVAAAMSQPRRPARIGQFCESDRIALLSEICPPRQSARLALSAQSR
jgi:hypothetical protein